MKNKPVLVASATQTKVTEFKNYGKPFISEKIHKKLIEITIFYKWFYDTKKTLIWIEGKAHKIIIIKGKAFFQYKQETLRSLKREYTLMKAMKNTNLTKLKPIFFE